MGNFVSVELNANSLQIAGYDACIRCGYELEGAEGKGILMASM